MWLSTWETSDYQVDGQTLKFGTPAFEDWLLGEMERVRQLAASRGARLVFVTNPPTAPNPPSPILAKTAARYCEQVFLHR